MKKFIPLLLFVFTATTIFQPVHAQNGGQVKIYAIQFHADWCGLCRILDPKVDQLKTRFTTDEVKFLQVDLTDRQTKTASRKRLDKLGLADHFDNNNGTAFVLLVNARTGKAITKLYRGYTVDEMYKIIQARL